VNLAIHGLPLFLTAALLVNLTPGPDMLLVAGSSAVHGRRAGVLAALGVGAGCLLHVALAAVGLSALLAASATAFTLVKWVGAAYLVWVGISMLRARPAPGLRG
jgi:threonine/homoserine/homoserine lactone efflux protein